MTLGSWLLVAVAVGVLLFLTLWFRALLRNIRDAKNHDYPRPAVNLYLPGVAVVLLVLIARTLLADEKAGLQDLGTVLKLNSRRGSASRSKTAVSTAPLASVAPTP